jgi:hypothetical protein
MERFYIVTGLVLGLSGVAIATTGIGPGLCFSAIGAGEFIEFVRPSAPACHRRGPDFGPPSGCDGESQPHNKMIQATSLSSTTTSLGAMVAFDADYFELKDWK